MKKAFLLISFITSSVIYLSSCSDTTITAPKGEYTQWSIIDSTSPNEYVRIISQDENNYVYYITNLGLYKVNENFKKKINLPNAAFRAEIMKTYNKDYTVLYGYSGNKLQLNILQGETFTTVNLDSLGYTSRMEMAILSPGKIFASMGLTIYKFDNGSITRDSLPHNSLTSFANTQNGLFAFADYSTGCNIYYFNNNRFNFQTENVRAGYNLPLGNSIIRVTANGTDLFNISYFTNKFDFVTSVSTRRVLSVSGDDKNYFYAILLDTNNSIGAYVWNGAALVKDGNAPANLAGWSTIEISQMKNSVFYLSNSFGYKNYIYKVSRVPVY